MNYIKQLNEFYKNITTEPLTPNAKNLYETLLHINSDSYWKEEIVVANPYLILLTGLNKQKVDRARNELIQKGYIGFKKGINQNQAGKYCCIKLYSENNTTNDIPNDIPNNTATNTAANTATDTINKQNKTKQNNKEKYKKEKDEDFSSTFEKSNKENQEKLKTIIDFYENNIAPITQYVAEDMEKYLQEGAQEDLIIACMEEAVSRNKRFWKYVASTLNNCLNSKITTKRQFKTSQDEFKTNKNQVTKKEKTEEKIEYEELYFDSEEEYRKKLFEKQKG